jgi:hemoglobin-like flavoprotein
MLLAPTPGLAAYQTKMNSQQILLVRSSWPSVAANADALTTRFYSRLFEIDDGAARLFAGVDMTAQRAKLAQALAVVVKALDDPDRLLPPIAALGKRHAHYGVEFHHFDSVGEALLGALGDSIGDEFTSDVRAAWADAYAFVASVMRRALIRAAEIA